MTLREHKKYLREQKAFSDKHQLQLDTLEPSNFSLIVEPPLSLDPEQNVICPFCLYKDVLQKFLFSTGNGFHKGLGLCPECKQKAMFRTLLNLPKWSPSQYADFVFNYVTSGFWEKCKYTTWSIRLNKNIYISTEFWNRYNQLKAEKNFDEG